MLSSSYYLSIKYIALLTFYKNLWCYAMLTYNVHACFDGFVQVVRELQHSRDGVKVTTEDGCVYEANYVILSVSIGVLQSHLISFNPQLPVRILFLSVYLQFLIEVRCWLVSLGTQNTFLLFFYRWLGQPMWLYLVRAFCIYEYILYFNSNWYHLSEYRMLP